MMHDRKLNEKEVSKLRRSLHRYYAGANVPADYVVMTLTTPEDICLTDDSLHKAFVKFKLRLSRMGIKLEYYGVREYNKERTCEHVHLVIRAKRLCPLLMRVTWTLALYGKLISARKDGLVIVFIRRRYGDGKGLANYLSKYLVKHIGEKTNTLQRGFWYSYGWIFRGWRNMHKLAWRFGVCVDDAYWRELNEKETKICLLTKRIEWIMILSRLARKMGLIIPWSISFKRELKSIGLVWYGREWVYG